MAAIEVVDIQDSQVHQLLSSEEGHFLDLKAIEITPAKLTKSLSAFANSDGGELYVGIDEIKPTKKGSWRGFSNVEAANGHLQAFQLLFPLGDETSYTFLKNKNSLGLVLKIEIQKSRSIKFGSNKIPYVRFGAQSLSL